MRLSLLLLSLIFAAAAVYGRIQSSGIASTVDLLDSQVASRSAAARDDEDAGFRAAERVSRLTQEAEAVEAELRVIAAREEEVSAHKCGKQDFVRRAKERLRVAKMQTEADFESKIKDKKDRAAEEIAAMEAEAESLRAEIAAMHAEEQRLATDASKAEGDLVIGGFLLNGEFGAVERFLDRVVRGVDTFRGTFVLNRQVISPDGAPLTVARAGNRLSKIGAVTDPLRRAIPKSDPFIFPEKVTYASCAVVGKSKVLLLRELGPDIDAADAVLRMDDATTKGFEDYVGSRTSIRFVCSGPFAFRESNEEVVLQQVATTEGLSQFLQYKREHPKSAMFMLSAEFHAFVENDLLEPASSALFAILFALQRCHQVKVYGLHGIADSQGGPGGGQPLQGHYYDSTEARAAMEAREAALVAELARRSAGRLILDEYDDDQ